MQSLVSGAWSLKNNAVNTSKCKRERRFQYPPLPSQLGNTTLIFTTFPFLEGALHCVSSSRPSSFHLSECSAKTEALGAEGNFSQVVQFCFEAGYSHLLPKTVLEVHCGPLSQMLQLCLGWGYLCWSGAVHRWTMAHY